MQTLLNKLNIYMSDDEEKAKAHGLLFLPMNYDPPVLRVSINYDTIYSETVGNNPY